ncbi:hypothetical protein [Nitrosomonas sp. ANs5]|uniref:hypothetical protein n=1 Tax=Nitrosomonas sp. ANs5 TaxID=3423941 RepID=UPI003D32C1EF
MVFVADARMIANLWLRPDDSHSGNSVRAFLDDTLDKLGGQASSVIAGGYWATEAAMLAVMLACNLMHLFRQIVLRNLG